MTGEPISPKDVFLAKSDTPGPPSEAALRTPISDKALADALAAVRTMARLSNRSQADLDAAFARANLSIGRDRYEEICTNLKEKGFIRDIIVLGDGGVIVTVEG